MNLNELKTPFAPEDIEWRVQQKSKNKPKVSVLAYLTSRAVMDRLDEVCGPSNWRNEYQKGPEGGVICGISIKIGDEWVTKWDGAENTDIEKVKGGLSNAMKRAAVQWGIGRYLYNLPATWVDLKDRGAHYLYDKDTKTTYYWDEPQLPKWALPGAKDTNRPSATTVVLSEQEQHVDQTTGEITAKPTPDEVAIQACGTIEDWLKKSGLLKSNQVSALRKKYTGVADLTTAPLVKKQEYLRVLIQQKESHESRPTVN